MQFDLTKNITLENDRVILQPLTTEDWQLLLPIATADKTLMQYSPSRTYNETYLKEYIDTALKAKNTGVRFPFTIFDKQKNEYAGCTSFGNISNKNLRVEIGWTWLGKEFQGTGLNKACKFLMLSYAFETLEFDFEIAELRKKLIYEHHIFTGGASNKKLLRILPPMTIKKEHVDTFFEALKSCL